MFYLPTFSTQLFSLLLNAPAELRKMTLVSQWLNIEFRSKIFVSFRFFFYLIKICCVAIGRYLIRQNLLHSRVSLDYVDDM